ncbi:MAG: cytidylate kinase-like family protein [Clostridia bacterium]|nr:cytidylate kinase-like family protein [Clostridia bacterium]
MNKVITIGREFGSGGRELALKLSEALGYEYYDREIIEEISKRTELSEKYVQQVVEHDPHSHFPITVGHTFSYLHHYGIERQQAVYREQCEVIKKMADTSNCIIVGRCADYILKDYNPLKLFVYSDIDHKIKRCKERADVCEHYTDKQLKKYIKEVDKNRARYYRFYTGNEWGDKLNYDICINMATTDIDKVVAMLVKMLKD